MPEKYFLMYIAAAALRQAASRGHRNDWKHWSIVSLSNISVQTPAKVFLVQTITASDWAHNYLYEFFFYFEHDL